MSPWSHSRWASGLVGVTGCSTDQQATTPEAAETAPADDTIEQARQDPIDLVTATTALLASDNWESSSGLRTRNLYLAERRRRRLLLLQSPHRPAT